MKTSRRQREESNSNYRDSDLKRRVKSCIRYARMCEPGSESRIFWLRHALISNAERYHNIRSETVLRNITTKD